MSEARYESGVIGSPAPGQPWRSPERQFRHLVVECLSADSGKVLVAWNNELYTATGQPPSAPADRETAVFTRSVFDVGFMTRDRLRIVDSNGGSFTASVIMDVDPIGESIGPTFPNPKKLLSVTDVGGPGEFYHAAISVPAGVQSIGLGTTWDIGSGVQLLRVHGEQSGLLYIEEDNPAPWTVFPFPGNALDHTIAVEMWVYSNAHYSLDVVGMFSPIIFPTSATAPNPQPVTDTSDGTLYGASGTVPTGAGGADLTYHLASPPSGILHLKGGSLLIQQAGAVGGTTKVIVTLTDGTTTMLFGLGLLALGAPAGPVPQIVPIPASRITTASFATSPKLHVQHDAGVNVAVAASFYNAP